MATVMNHRSNGTTAISPSATETRPLENKWGPYTNAKDFAASMAIVLVILICAAVLVCSLTTTIRSIIRRRRRILRNSSPTSLDLQKQHKQALADIEALPPALVFSANSKEGKTLVGAGTAPECPICLAEFVDGERVRVLPACGHGFHADCVEVWLKSSSSCPTCRSSCGCSSKREMEEP